MRHGDFTELAKYYINRPGYSHTVLECLKNYIFNSVGEGLVADIGAGTGKLTENLADLGLRGFAIEPNEAMRNKGGRYLKAGRNFYGRKALPRIPD